MPKCYQSIVVNAPITTVWDTIKDFHDISWASQVLEKCEAMGELSGTKVGAKRILNEAFHETLLELNEQNTEYVILLMMVHPLFLPMKLAII
ncbi:MAG: SRPBCC family protein [Methylococcales bacterium]|nr:SRPBCC family protein [Methylococcales bacterium]